MIVRRPSALSPHTTGSLFGRRFQNPNPDFRQPTALGVLRWLGRRLVLGEGLPSFATLDSHPPFPGTEPQRDVCVEYANRFPTSFTWVGHSTFLVQIDGLSVLTDPVWSPRVFPGIGPHRLLPPGLPLTRLPPIDAVLISHDHYDHLDLRTLEALGPGPLYCVPSGLRSLLLERGLERIQEFSWWDFLEWGPLRIGCVPAQHFSVRGILDRGRTLWAGWVIEGTKHRVYFAGDTGFFAGQFEEIRRVCGPPDAAILPIGAYRPAWLMRPVHMDPVEAILATRILGAPWLIPCHWGTFRLSAEPADEPVRFLRQEISRGSLTGSNAWIPSPGVTRHLAA